MSSDKKSKKKNIEELEEVLDNPSYDDIKSKDKKHLIDLKNRLRRDKERKNIAYRKVESINDYEKSDEDPLKPKVVIHQSERKKPKISELKEFTEIEEETVEEVIVEEGEEKVPEFININPKKTVNKNLEENSENISEWEPFEDEESEEIKSEFEEATDEEIIEETEEVKEKKDIVESKKTSTDLVEVDEPKKEIPKDHEPEEIIEEKIDNSYKIEVFQNIKCIDDEIAIILFNSGFCSIDDLRLTNVEELCKIEDINKKIARDIINEIKEIDESSRLKPVIDKETEGKDLTEEETEKEQDEIDDSEKIKSFENMKSIDDKTAILLYDNFIRSEEDLKDISYHDLKKIKGLKRKDAKNIIKELEEKIKEAAELKPINVGDSAEGEISEDQIKDEIDEKEEDKQVPKPVELESSEEHWEPVSDDKIEGSDEWENIDDENWDDVSFDKEGFRLDSETEKKIDVFSDMNSIDKDTAILLYDNGYDSIDSLTLASYKDLKNIKGINRKTAKNIIKEIEEMRQNGSLLPDEEFDLKPHEESFVDEDTMDEDSIDIDEKIIGYDEKEPKKDIFEEDMKEIEEEISLEDSLDRPFEKIKSIDDKTSELLIKNGISSIGDLMDKNIKDLTKIRGIRKKLARKIKNEVNKLEEESYKSEKKAAGVKPLIDQESEEEEWAEFDEEEEVISSVPTVEEKIGYKHKKYTLFEKEITVKGGSKRKIRFFSKEKPDDGKPIDIPDGYIVKVNKRTGVPYLKKKK